MNVLVKDVPLSIILRNTDIKNLNLFVKLNMEAAPMMGFFLKKKGTGSMAFSREFCKSFQKSYSIAHM